MRTIRACADCLKGRIAALMVAKAFGFATLLWCFVPSPSKVRFNALRVWEVHVVKDDMVISRNIGQGQFDIAV